METRIKWASSVVTEAVFQPKSEHLTPVAHRLTNVTCDWQIK